MVAFEANCPLKSKNNQSFMEQRALGTQVRGKKAVQ